MKLYKIIHARHNNAGDIESKYTRLIISNSLPNAVEIASKMFRPEELVGNYRFKPFYEEVYDLNPYGGDTLLKVGNVLVRGKKQSIVTQENLKDGKATDYYPTLKLEIRKENTVDENGKVIVYYPHIPK